MDLHYVSSPLLKLNGVIITDFIVLKKENFYAVVNGGLGGNDFQPMDIGM
jgi:glycine cleavage system aminomethyltransferase T